MKTLPPLQKKLALNIRFMITRMKNIGLFHQNEIMRLLPNITKTKEIKITKCQHTKFLCVSKLKFLNSKQRNTTKLSVLVYSSVIKGSYWSIQSSWRFVLAKFEV